MIAERKPKKLVRDFQEGQHEGSIRSVATIETLSVDEKQTWRTIRKELEEIGISVTAFDANKGLIMEWFQNALVTGAFEERQDDSDESSHSSLEADFKRASQDSDGRPDSLDA